MRAMMAAAVAATTVLTATPAVAAPPTTATRVEVERSGGFAGRQDSFVVDRRTAGSQRVLRLAGSDEFRRLRGVYQAANPCCDLYAYRVTVSYRGGRDKVVSTTQGAESPRVLWTVIDEAVRRGRS